MLLETFWCIESYFSFSTYCVFSKVIFLVFNCCNFVVSNQLRVLFFTHCEIVIVKSSFISNLLRNELSVVSGRDALIYKFLLIWGNHQISIYELCHFYVVSEDIKWQILTLSNSYEFIFWLILLIRSINHCHFVISRSTLFKCSNW